MLHLLVDLALRTILSKDIVEDEEVFLTTLLSSGTCSTNLGHFKLDLLRIGNHELALNLIK